MKAWPALLIVLIGCHAAPPKPEEKTPVPVHAGVVEMQESREETRYSADVSPDHQVDLAFRVSGYVQSLLTVGSRSVQEGDVVRAGAVLARVRAVDYTNKVSEARTQVEDARAAERGARAQLAEAEAGLRKADQDLARARSLYESKSLTLPDLEAAQAQHDAAAARVVAARAQIESMAAKIGGAQGQQTEAEVALGDTELKAPFTGVVLARRVEQGALAVAGSPAFTLADVRSVKVDVGVPDVSLAAFRQGAVLLVTTEAVPQTEFHGRITAISPAADPKGRVFTVELTIANPRGLLKPGMVASVAVVAQGSPMMAAVPVSAVVQSAQDADRYAVFVLERHDGKTLARRQRVALGDVKGNRIAVREGLVAGQRIVASGGSLLTDGEPVREIP